MPDIQTLNSVAEFLQHYGGWAVSIFLVIAIVYLYRSMNGLLERRNAQLVGLLAECKAVVAENKIFMDRVEDTIEESNEGIKTNTELLRDAAQAFKRNAEVLDQVRILLEVLNRRPL